MTAAQRGEIEGGGWGAIQFRRVRRLPHDIEFRLDVESAYRTTPAWPEINIRYEHSMPYDDQ